MFWGILDLSRSVFVGAKGLGVLGVWNLGVGVLGCEGVGGN